jgi:HEAT repeat protein
MAWTPKRGTQDLAEHFGSDASFVLLTRLLLGEVRTNELTSSPFREALCFIGDGHAEQLLRDPINTSQLYWTRSWAARSLAYFGDKDAGTWLIAALEDSHWRVRMTAAQSLGRLGIAAKDKLTALLEDEHERVRDAAALALERVEGKQALPNFDDDAID